MNIYHGLLVVVQQHNHMGKDNNRGWSLDKCENVDFLFLY